MTNERRAEGRGKSPGNAPAPSAAADRSVHEQVRGAVDPKLRRLSEVVGYPVLAYYLAEDELIADAHVLHIYEHLRRVGKVDRLGLFLSSRGGHTEVPWKIVSLLREFARSWTALIPYRAHSAATLIALGADEIVMTEMSELSPIDPSRTHPLLPAASGGEGASQPVAVSVQDLRHVLSFLERQVGAELPPEVASGVYTSLFDHVHPLAIGALEQSWALSEQVCEQVLSTHVRDEAEIDRVVQWLTSGYQSHRYPISRRDARDLGLRVINAEPSVVEAMWALYRTYEQEIRVDGEGRSGGRRTQVRAAGYINSEHGSTVGVKQVLTDGSGSLGSEWGSLWWGNPKPGL